MKRGWISRVSAVFFAALLGVALVPGCVLKITTGEGAGTAGDPVSGETSTTSSSPAAPSEEEQQQAEMLFAQLDPAELSYASALAGNTTCALAGAIESLGLDPETVDEVALQALVEQHLPAAVEQAKIWMNDLDLTALPLSVTPKFECEEQYGCAYRMPCAMAYIPSVKHLCFVDDCGPGKCGTCPELVNMLLRNIALKAWCSYVCIEMSTSPPKIVAVGAGGVSAFKSVFIGPACVPP